ncbi:rhodanese-like domain-containing protein [Actimicrobium sp. CCI2.3]|uniref:rhodanese-like domain-containing protein n=1 Tax=Actimicrobium sp. CCI2.3 TaxID=3048616 RepID=UPI002AB37F1D|nr:rhodanese-like domain-containing protein [Actimicrobium sp. CCI2.3]MDY7574691.1 rhodanese-like domain-containing protein [Actimicrobium sp. CCI2.3]MEB0020353.1 rhodanese-like domain-containing protein [Actimicrobium sp. CCI2.3]
MKTALELVAAAKTRIREVALDDADLAIRHADVVLDVREADEYAAGHIPGALAISRGMMEFTMSSKPEFATPDLNIVLYCKTGGRAALAALALLDMGYRNVQSIAGGFDGWRDAGKAVTVPTLPAVE